MPVHHRIHAKENAAMRSHERVGDGEHMMGR